MEHFWGEANIGPKKVPVWRVLCIAWLDIFSPADSLLASSITFSFREIGCFLLILSRQSCSFLGKAHRSSSVNGYFVSAKICDFPNAGMAVSRSEESWVTGRRHLQKACSRHRNANNSDMYLFLCSWIKIYCDIFVEWFYLAGIWAVLDYVRLCRI